MNLKVGLVAASLFGTLAASSTASAMPVAPAPATPQLSGLEQVRMVCDAWGQCWWRPNYYGYYAPRPYYYGPRYYGPRYYGPRYYGPRYYGHYGYRRWCRLKGPEGPFALVRSCLRGDHWPAAIQI